MVAETTYKRMNPDTVNGNMIILQTVYSSFDRDEIDALEKTFKKNIGTGLITEYKYGEEEQEHE